MKNINDVIRRQEYGFLKTDPHLGENIMFVTFGGSYGYGNPTELSDIDVRGCTMSSPADILGRNHFERFADKDTDTVIHSFVKTVNLIVSGNPYAAELLGMDEEQYALVSPLGRSFLEHSQLFLSQRVTNAYVGYIYGLTSWLDGLQRRMTLGNQPNEKKLFAACEPAVQRFNKQLQAGQGSGARLYLDASTIEGQPREAHMDMDIKGVPLRQVFPMLDSMRGIVKNYEETAAQRKSLSIGLIGKKTATLMRMLLTCCELLETGRLVTHRTNEADLLLEMRNGKYIMPDCRLQDELYDMINPILKRLEYDRTHTVLPEAPDEAAVNEFVMELSRKVLFTKDKRG